MEYPSTLPLYVALADVEIHIAPDACITLRPLVRKSDDSMEPASPHLRLTQQQARELAADLIAAADQSAEAAALARH